jgi:hypothetical protein
MSLHPLADTLSVGLIPQHALYNSYVVQSHELGADKKQAKKGQRPALREQL